MDKGQKVIRLVYIHRSASRQSVVTLAVNGDMFYSRNLSPVSAELINLKLLKTLLKAVRRRV